VHVLCVRPLDKSLLRREAPAILMGGWSTLRRVLGRARSSTTTRRRGEGRDNPLARQLARLVRALHCAVAAPLSDCPKADLKFLLTCEPDDMSNVLNDSICATRLEALPADEDIERGDCPEANSASKDFYFRALIEVMMPNPFAQILASTGGVHHKSKHKISPLMQDNMSPAYSKIPLVQVSVIERLTTRTLSVCWSDPRCGKYTDQLWRLGLARDDGLCAFSGMYVRRGDSVFRPSSSVRLCPAAFDRMILASQAPSPESMS
jgi:hypothetical protein